MSTNQNGHNLRDWSLYMLVAGLVFTFAIVGIAFAMAIMNPESDMVITGSLDISQFVAVILGIAIVATVLVSQQLTSKQNAAVTKQADDAWMAEGLMVSRPTTPGKTTGFSMEELYAKTLLITTYIRKIYDSDASLTPAEQQEAIKILPGITAAEMEALIPVTGPTLADSIRKLISKHRATDRTTKDKSS